MRISPFFIAAALAASPLAMEAALAQASSSDVATKSVTEPVKKTGPTGAATAGTGGTATQGTNSATTLGIGGTSASDTQRSSALGVSGSAASADGTADTRAAVHGNRNLTGIARATARDDEGRARSMTICKDKLGRDVTCTTRNMTHAPGEKPVKTTTQSGAGIE